MDIVRGHKAGADQSCDLCLGFVFTFSQLQDDGSPVSIFEFDSGSPAKRNLMPLAKNALRKLRTVRHPDVLRFIDVVETDTTIHIMTERIRPLLAAISEWASKGSQERENWLIWGLHRVSVRHSTFIPTWTLL